MIRVVYSISAAIALTSNAFLISLLVFPDSPSACSHLWPKRTQTCHGNSALQLSKDFKLKIPQDSHPGLIAAAVRYRDRIFASVFRSLPVDPARMAKVDQSQTSLDSVEVNVEDLGTETLRLEIDESYRSSIALNKGLDVRFGINEEHCARTLQGCPLQDKVKSIITAKTAYGSLHGLGTFAQLITSSHDNPMEDVCNPNLIHDRPLIPRRGFMLDNSSSYLSMTSLYRTIDTMTLSKFDVFHRRNADSQRFPSVMDDEPDMVLDTVDGEKKTTAFPAIRVCLDGYPSYGRLSAEAPNGQRNQVGPKTYKGIQDVSDQVLSLLKDEYVYAGADVANQEVPLPDHILEDNKDTLIQNWKISQNIKKAIQRGYKAISGSADYGYLDRGSVDRLDNWSLSRPWCGPYKSSQKIYSFNPLMGLDYAETEKVLSGHALTWGEQLKNANLHVFCSYPSK